MARKSVRFESIAIPGALISAAAAYLYWLRPWQLKWGTQPGEVETSYPGDVLVPQPRLDATHAVSISAPPDHIWPWLVQIGTGRGGFYSYDFLENLMGLGVHSTASVLPEYQALKAGDRIPLASGGYGLPVKMIEPGKFLVLHGDTRASEDQVDYLTSPGNYFNSCWAFYLRPASDGTTRLVERFRADWNPNLRNWAFVHILLEPASFMMGRKMLLGIKQRVENAR